MIITIDGPAGSGKSTAARKLAARLEIAYLDTGSMYRAIALRAIRLGTELTDSAELMRVAADADLEVDCGPTFTRLRLDGHDVTEAIRAFDINNVTPYVATHQGIRDLLVQRQRQIGRRLGSLVTEGRDQGSVVFPHADIKFVMDATLDRRAARRFQELLADGEQVTLEDVRENLALRDRDDSRQWAPLLTPGAAIRIDTTTLTIAEVVDQLAEHIHRVEVRRSSPQPVAGSEPR